MTDTTKTPEQIAAEAKALKEAKAAEAKQAKAEKAAALKAEKEKAAAEKKAAKDAAEAAKQAEKDAAAAKVADAKKAKEDAVAAKAAEKEAKLKAKADAKAAKEAQRMPEQNGVRRPGPAGLCGQAWAVFDELSAAQGKPVAIADALVEAGKRKLNDGNVRTEYARWKKFFGISGRIEKAATETPAAQ